MFESELRPWFSGMDYEARLYYYQVPTCSNPDFIPCNYICRFYFRRSPTVSEEQIFRFSLTVISSRRKFIKQCKKRIQFVKKMKHPKTLMMREIKPIPNFI